MNVRQFLAEFSGIRFPSGYSVGVQFNCSDGDWWRHVRCYEADLGVRLYPVAEETEMRHQHLLLGDNGIVYELSLDSNSGDEFSSLHPFALTLPSALRSLLRPTNKTVRRNRRDDLKSSGHDPDFGRRIVVDGHNNDYAENLIVENLRRGS